MGDCAETKGVEALREELAFYETMKAEWLLAHEGKFVLIKGKQLLGFFDTQEQAYSEGLKRLGNKPFLIKQVVKEEPIQTIPALHYGLIPAHT